MLATLLSTYGIIFVAELPDKTALAALLLATRFRVRDVVAGAWLAFLLHAIISAGAGGLLHLLPARPVQVAAGAGFLLFAILALRRNEEAALAEEAREVQHVRRRLPVWVVCFVVVFVAEWGDLTQLATAALVARSRDPLVAAAGALLALWSVTVLAAFAGSQTGRFLSPMVLNRIAAGLFAVVGAAFLASAFR